MDTNDTARQLARELDCLTEEDIAALSKTEVSTTRNWRSRRFGPPYVVLGNVTLYPVAAAKDWVARNAEATLPAAAAFEHLPARGQRRRRTTA